MYELDLKNLVEIVPVHSGLNLLWVPWRLVPFSYLLSPPTSASTVHSLVSKLSKHSTVSYLKVGMQHSSQVYIFTAILFLLSLQQPIKHTHLKLLTLTYFQSLPSSDCHFITPRLCSSEALSDCFWVKSKENFSPHHT